MMGLTAELAMASQKKDKKMCWAYHFVPNSYTVVVIKITSLAA